MRIGSTIAYLSESGFYFDGQPIGDETVNRTFLSAVADNTLFSVVGRLDPTRGLIWWHYKTTATTYYDKALIYRWRTNRWASAEFNCHLGLDAATPGLTLEQIGALYPDLETVPYSLDSRVWQAGRPVYAVFDTDYKLAFLEGTNLEAVLRTPPRQLVPNRRSRLLGVRPMDESGSSTVRVARQATLDETPSWSSAISQESGADGACPCDVESRIHTVETTIPAGASWSHAYGAEVEDDWIKRGAPR